MSIRSLHARLVLYSVPGEPHSRAQATGPSVRRKFVQELVALQRSAAVGTVRTWPGGAAAAAPLQKKPGSADSAA